MKYILYLFVLAALSFAPLYEDDGEQYDDGGVCRQ